MLIEIAESKGRVGVLTILTFLFAGKLSVTILEE
jgi:hypothetical protein